MVAGSAKVEPHRPLAGRRAVAVDDDPSVLGLIAGYLAGAGCEVVSFTRFADAKSHVLASPPDILVTDLRLGAFNGLQLVGLAKSRRPDTTAVILTGFDDPVLRRESETLGAVFLLKPLRRADLIKAVAGDRYS